MKLSFVIELLLIFLLIAFAASRVIDTREGRAAKKQSVKQDDTSNRYCSCSTESCNCCREFTLPVVPIKGPGCATLQYLQGDNMALSMKFGDRVLTNTTISGKKPKPVCMRLPGGFSKFCGRVYGISRDPEAFHACLGLEIRALDDIEAALRLSCFRFSPEGLRLEPGKPVPVDEEEEEEDEDDYGFGDDDDDDDDEDEEEEEEEETEEDTEEDDDDDDDDLEAAGVGDDNEISADYAGFSILGDLLGFGDESLESPPKKKPAKKPLTPATVVASDNKVPQPVAVVVHVSPIHNTPVVIETVTTALSNNKVMDKIEVTTAAPTKAPPKSPPKVQPKPTRAPTAAPAKAPPKVTTAAPVTAAPAVPVVSAEAFKPTTSTEFTVSVVQDGQTLQPTEEVSVTVKDEMVEFTTVVQPVEEEDMQYGEDDGKEENVPVVTNEVVMAAEAAKEEETAAEEETAEEEMMNDEEGGEEEVDIGVVKEEETQSNEDNMAASETATVSMDEENEMITENFKVEAVQVTSEAAPTVSAVVPTESAVTGDRDEDEEAADSVVEEVEEAVATVIGQGEEEDDEDDEDDDDDDEEEADEGEKDGEKEDEDDYGLGLDDDDDEDDKEEITTTEKAAEPSLKVGERRWRRRKNRLDHIFWH